MTSDSADTIVATSSPAGRSVRAIVRLSGPDAVRIASAVFESDEPIGSLPSYSSTDGLLVLERGQMRCPAAAYVMLAPRSYTREDVVELHTVGAPPLLAELVDALTGEGARPAEPGEFTRRAFLNGRLDLTQAEAVQAVIGARSEAELRVSQAQLGGAFRNLVEGLRADVLRLLAEVEASIDFTDQDIRLIEPADVAARAEGLKERVESVAGAGPAAPPKDGVATAICGLPNAGKSSLLNALAGRNRAIVTHVPGTTRDTVEHTVEVGGVQFRLIDTAGVRRTGRSVEEQAIERTNLALESADLVLLVIDGSRRFAPGASKLWEGATARRVGAAVIAVVNKSDLDRGISMAAEGRLAQRCPVVNVSAVSGDGLDELRAEMSAAVRSDAMDRSAHAFWVGARHRASLGRAVEALSRAREALADGLGFEFAAVDLRGALAALGDIVGITTDDDVLDTIFSQFCIGK